MPNKYDDFLFDDEEKKEPIEDDLEKFALSSPYVPEGIKEPLDEILDNIELFNEHAAPFSKLLSATKAVDHKVDKHITDFFFDNKDKHDKGSLKKEKDYHQLLLSLFEQIISPMKNLAQIHLNTVKQFNRDIDKSYYSIDKMDKEVKEEKSDAVEGIYLQRLILSDAANDLETLEDALKSTESRLKKYIDAGGDNNISASEVAIISSQREKLTSGQNHTFDFSFFQLNAIDKAAITFGLYQKETSNQYIKHLSKVFQA